MPASICTPDRSTSASFAFHGNLPAQPQALAQALASFHDPAQPQQLVLACECMFAWYWLGDWCAERGIPFVLGHALYRKAIHGGKAKNDKIDAHKIATLLRGGLLPQVPQPYVYPKAMRATRDLLRRRMFLVQACSPSWAATLWIGPPAGDRRGDDEENATGCPTAELTMNEGPPRG